LFPAENRLAQIELARLRALVQLYKALGGGWSLDQVPGEETSPTPSAPEPEPVAASDFEAAS